MHGVNPTPFHTFALRLAAPRGSNITLERKKLGPIFRVARADLGRKGDRFQVLQHVTPQNSTKFTKLPDGKTTISHNDKGDGVAQNSFFFFLDLSLQPSFFSGFILCLLGCALLSS